MGKLRSVWEDLRSSLWFVPALMVAGAVALAIGLIALDPLSTRWELTQRWPRLFGAGAEGARGLLSAIAGSMITVAGVTFSITVVALALASSQYTSRILATFMRDRANQSVLGVFLGVFAYCLVVLRTIRGSGEELFVPALAVLGAVLLAFVAIAFLIFFIHHIAESIQATSVIETTAVETLHAIDRLFPADVGQPAAVAPDSDSDPPGVVADADTWTTIPSQKSGYIQAVDDEALFRIAHDRGMVLRMGKGIGEFVIESCPLASVAGNPPDEDVVRSVNLAYSIGRHRTVHQDPGYGVRQIVDVALKALSPGINDTTTAISCIDFLGAILVRLADRRVEPTHRSDGGQTRIIARGPGFPDLLAEAFNQIRHNAESNVVILIRVLQILEILADRIRDPRRIEPIRQQADLITRAAERGVPEARDRAMIQAARGRVLPNPLAGQGR